MLRVAHSTRAAASGPTDHSLLTNLQVTIERNFERDYLISLLLHSIAFHSTVSKNKQLAYKCLKNFLIPLQGINSFSFLNVLSKTLFWLLQAVSNIAGRAAGLELS